MGQQPTFRPQGTLSYNGFQILALLSVPTNRSREMDDEVPNLAPPPNPNYSQKWAEFLAWRLGRYIRRVMGSSSPRSRSSIARQLERGLEDDGRPLPGEAPPQSEGTP